MLDAYRNGDISLDVVTAFTLGADHQAQLAVWHQLKDHSYIPPYTVRRLLTQTAIRSFRSRPVCRRTTYEAAGGTVTRDLFSADDEGFMDDAALVRRLASRSSNRKPSNCAPPGPGPGRCSIPRTTSPRIPRIRPQPAELPAEIAREIERIEQRLGEPAGNPRGRVDRRAVDRSGPAQERHDELVESVEDLAVYSEKDRAGAGIIVTIGDDGEFRLHEGLVERSAIGAEDKGDDENVEFEARRGEEISRYSPNGEQAMRKECGFSQLLVDDLKAHRLQITRAHLAADFDVAFDLVLYALCIDLFERFGYRLHSLDLRATPTPLHSSLNDLAGARRIVCSRRRATRSISTGLICRRRRASRRLRRCHQWSNSGSSRDASPFASSRSWRSKTGPIRSSKLPARGSRSRLPITGSRLRSIIGAGSKRRTASPSAGRSSAIAGFETTPAIRSRSLPQRSKPPSIP